MKSKFIYLFIIVTAFCLPVFSQVKITAKKITYKRPNPIMDFKKSFTITYPKIKAATPALSRKIETVFSYEKAFDFKLREEINDVQWLEEASYDVNYNADKMLSISLTIQGTGAYPSSSTKYIVANTANGTRIRPADIFADTSGLLAKISKLKDAEIKKTLTDLKNDPANKDEDFSGIFNDAETYSKLTLDEFELDENGVVFHYDYGFPHVALALQPPGEYFLTWKDLKPYIKPDGLLGQFVR